MGTKVKFVKRKRRINLQGIMIIVFVLSIFIYVSAMTALSSYNVTLMAKTDQLQKKKGQIAVAIEGLTQEVQELSSPQRILDIAKKAGIVGNQENIVNLPDDNK